jgi:hypothetical protein
MAADNKHESLLEEIRENHTFASHAWSDIRDESKEDMRYIAGDPWDPKEKQARIDANRPCIVADELNQYLNQLVNDVRMNKRAVKVNPTGSGATDQSAELLGNMIRGIEYKSNAQTAYDTAFESAASRGYGFFRIKTRYISDSSFNQEIFVKRIPNPDTVLPDPDYTEADSSDANFYFVTESIKRSMFKKKYPNAEITDFDKSHKEVAPQWIRDDHIQIAEYWKVEKKPRTLILLNDNGETKYLDELGKGAKLQDSVIVVGAKKIPFLDSRKAEDRQVIQYITNGVEILEENEWAGKWIPIIPVFGKELWLDDGSGSKRVLMSLVRLARDPYMLYCYYRTAEAEWIGMSPKVPYIGYVGQFDTNTDWANINKVPHGYAEVNGKTETTGDQLLPLPQRNLLEPPIQSLEMGAESARRAIMSAMGSSPLPTVAQRQNEKSGVALQKIATQQSIGTFHFIDNYDVALEFAGRQYQDLIPKIYDTDREVPTRTLAGDHKVVRINAEHKDKSGKPVNFKVASEEFGTHDVTISTGPSFQSQREEAGAFADTLATTPLFPKVADLIVKLKNLGPIGDEIAKRLTPPEFAGQDGEPLPPQALAAIQQSKQSLQQLNAYAQQLEAKVKELEQEKQAKVIEKGAELEKAKMDNATKITVAEIGTKAQVSMERMKWEHEAFKLTHGAAHDLGMQANDQQFQQQQAEQVAQQQEAAQASQMAEQSEGDEQSNA